MTGSRREDGLSQKVNKDNREDVMDKIEDNLGIFCWGKREEVLGGGKDMKKRLFEDGRQKQT